jgi:hypothetical protein
MAPTETPRIHVSDPGELIETIPYLLGFHPRQSLVLVGLRSCEGRPGPGEVQVAMRVDLPRSLPVGFGPDELAPLVRALLRVRAQSAICAIFTDLPAKAAAGPDADTEAGPDADADAGTRPRHWDALARAASAALDAAGVRLLDTVFVGEQRWWSLNCVSERCCPPQGRPRKRTGSAAAAEATYAGLVALPSRESLEAQLAGASLRKRRSLEPQLAAAEHRLVQAALQHRLGQLERAEADALRASARWLSAATAGKSAGRTPPRPLRPRQVARFGVALGELKIRDELWMAIDSRQLDAAELMRQLHSRLPPPYDAPPLFLLGWQLWRSGNGALALMAAERARRSDPRYTAAGLLLDVLEAGMDPRGTPRLADAVSQ